MKTTIESKIITKILLNAKDLKCRHIQIRVRMHDHCTVTLSHEEWVKRTESWTFTFSESVLEPFFEKTRLPGRRCITLDGDVVFMADGRAVPVRYSYIQMNDLGYDLILIPT